MNRNLYNLCVIGNQTVNPIDKLLPSLAKDLQAEPKKGALRWCG